MKLSLSNRLAVVFFAITALAIGVLYLYVAPGLQSRLMGEKLDAPVCHFRLNVGRKPAGFRVFGSGIEFHRHGEPASEVSGDG